jgi:hypothetical protein
MGFSLLCTFLCSHTDLRLLKWYYNVQLKGREKENGYGKGGGRGEGGEGRVGERGRGEGGGLGRGKRASVPRSVMAYRPSITGGRCLTRSPVKE